MNNKNFVDLISLLKIITKKQDNKFENPFENPLTERDFKIDIMLYLILSILEINDLDKLSKITKNLIKVLEEK